MERRVVIALIGSVMSAPWLQRARAAGKVYRIVFVVPRHGSSRLRPTLSWLAEAAPTRSRTPSNG